MPWRERKICEKFCWICCYDYSINRALWSKPKGLFLSAALPAYTADVTVYFALSVGGGMQMDKYVRARNMYSYPHIGLVETHNLNQFSDWSTAYSEKEFEDTLHLDKHHFNHLSSNLDDEVILGIFSVMFWGYRTSGAKSVTRCNWLAFGNAKNPNNSLTGLGKSLAVCTIRQALEDLRTSDYAAALRTIRKLPHVGVSFGTKYLAFLDPENVGVLDDKITKHLSAGKFTSLLGDKVVKQLVKPNYESNIGAEKRFAAYCEALNKIKVDLNRGLQSWEDVSGAEMARFRAVDVERALFSIAKANA